MVGCGYLLPAWHYPIKPVDGTSHRCCRRVVLQVALNAQHRSSRRSVSITRRWGTRNPVPWLCITLEVSLAGTPNAVIVRVVIGRVFYVCSAILVLLDDSQDTAPTYAASGPQPSRSPQWDSSYMGTIFCEVPVKYRPIAETLPSIQLSCRYSYWCAARSGCPSRAPFQPFMKFPGTRLGPFCTPGDSTKTRGESDPCIE